MDFVEKTSSPKVLGSGRSGSHAQKSCGNLAVMWPLRGVRCSALVMVLVALGAFSGNANAVNVLLVDDSEGQPVQLAWVTTLESLGHSVVVEAVTLDGNPSANFSDYDLVIWTVGDRAYGNLTSSNWAKITSYADQGGKILYAGGHSVFEEFLVGHAAIEAFFGVTNTHLNMPMWGANTTISGTGESPVFGTAAYSIVQDWAGGEWGDMFSGFGVSTATPIINQPTVINGAPGPYIVAQNSAGTAQLWGLDLNHIVPADREEFLGKAMTNLAVPEPTSAILIGLGLGALLLRRKRSERC